MSQDHRRGLSTRCVHGGNPSDPYGSPQTPIYPTTTFRFDSTASLLEAVAGQREGLYTRYGRNPSILALERRLALLEGAEQAAAFTSGMAAISALCLAYGRGGILCVGDAYGGTLELLTEQLPTLGYRTRCLVGEEVEQLEQVLSEEDYSLVLFETPGNPLLSVLDIQAIARAAHERGVLVAVDNTFATPVNQQPLLLGADFVVHSATKFLGGHSDITAGALMARAELLEPVLPWRKNLGQVPAPETAWLLARSLQTLTVRVERQSATALRLAGALAQHPKVARVFYPGLRSHPGHELAARQMQGFGAMLSLEVRGDDDAARRVVDGLRLFAIAPSLGGTESLATQPVTTTHHDLDEADRAARGITAQMIRLSVGLEDYEDLLADLDAALAAA